MFVGFVHAAILSILCLFLVLVPVSDVENTPSILEVDFFHLLVSVFLFTDIIKIKDVILYLHTCMHVCIYVCEVWTDAYIII